MAEESNSSINSKETYRERRKRLLREAKIKGRYERLGERGVEEGRIAGWWFRTTRSFRRFLKVLLKLGIIAIVIFLVYGLFASDAPAAVSIRAATGIERLEPLIGAIKTEYNPIKWFNEYILGIQEFSPPERAPETAVATVHIKNMRPIARTIYEKDRITIIGIAEIDPINIDNAKVAFACNLEKPDHKQGRAYISGKKGQENENIIEVQKNVEREVYFTCELDPVESIQGKEFDTYNVAVTWTYANFLTATDIGVIALSREKKGEAEATGRDPIAEWRTSDTITSKGTSQAFCVKNCGLSEIGLDVVSEMPLVENEEYHLVVSLQRLFEGSRRGEVKNLTSIRVLVPSDQNMAVNCDEFGNDLTLNEADGTFGQVSRYIGTQKRELKEKNMLPFFCTLKLASAPEIPTVVSIRAIAVFDYGDTYHTPIVVEKRPGNLAVRQPERVEATP